MASSSYCLGIPMPQCIEKLVETPPICIASQKDLDTIQVLREVGHERQRPEHEIIQATNLASGLSNIVVILLRPRLHERHHFDVDFNNFVQDCETLKVVDELIRFTSNKTRCIHTVTVLNAFSYQPLDHKPTLDKQSEKILSKMLQIKKPRIIIHYHNKKYTNSWIIRFNLNQGPYRLQRELVEISNNHSAIIIPSFHPSAAVNHDKHRPELQILLVYHFVNAFHALKYKPNRKEWPNLPCCAQEILESCRKVPTALSIPLKPQEQEAAFRVAWILKSSYHGPAIEAPQLSLFPADDGEEAKEQVNTFDALVFWSILVFQNPGAFDLSGLVRASFFLRKLHLPLYPAYERLRLLFLDSTTENAHWFCDNVDDTVADLSNQFSDLGLSEQSYQSRILQENKRAYEFAFQAASTLNESDGEIDQGDRRYYDATYGQGHFISKHLSDYKNFSIDKSIRIQTLGVQCEIFANSLLNSSLKKPENLTRTQQKDCFAELSSCLSKLRKEFE
jgi:hypothetical protein